MKIHVLSDLHLEFSDYVPPREAYLADVIVLAGDVHLATSGLHWASATFQHHEIIYVAGNHEFYRSQRSNMITALRKVAVEKGIHFLDNDEVVIDGVRFLGCTLWTDFELFGLGKKKQALSAVGRALNDFKLIKEVQGPFTARDSLLIHQESRTWLSERLQQPFEGQTVVITHHAPSWLSVVPRFMNDLVSAGFASRLEEMMGVPRLWIHGHMHDSLDYEIRGTRVICNPRGYALPGSNTQENLDFDPCLLIDLD